MAGDISDAISDSSRCDSDVSRSKIDAKDDP